MLPPRTVVIASSLFFIGIGALFAHGLDSDANGRDETLSRKVPLRFRRYLDRRYKRSVSYGYGGGQTVPMDVQREITIAQKVLRPDEWDIGGQVNAPISYNPPPPPPTTVPPPYRTPEEIAHDDHGHNQTIQTEEWFEGVFHPPTGPPYPQRDLSAERDVDNIYMNIITMVYEGEKKRRRRRKREEFLGIKLPRGQVDHVLEE